ncbi:hypothetical protein EYS14_14670 [Alteromonadaceae bacterium M269]|nr:hypothetical protein EYS14_14670 [Alteromonadaceae bacterium M269]
MGKIKTFANKTALDLTTPTSLFIVFFLVMSLLAQVSLRFPNAEILGATFVKHVSDIMTEHEAGKSMIVLMICAFILSLVRLLSYRNAPQNKYTLSLVHPVCNFLLSLVFVELAITGAVTLSALGKPLFKEMFLYMTLKNILLSITLLLSLMLLNLEKTQDTASRFYLISFAAILAAVHAWILNSWHEIQF